MDQDNEARAYIGTIAIALGLPRNTAPAEVVAAARASYINAKAVQVLPRVRALVDEWETAGGLAGAVAADRLRATLDSR